MNGCVAVAPLRYSFILTTDGRTPRAGEGDGDAETRDSFVRSIALVGRRRGTTTDTPREGSVARAQIDLID